MKNLIAVIVGVLFIQQASFAQAPLADAPGTLNPEQLKAYYEAIHSELRRELHVTSAFLEKFKNDPNSTDREKALYTELDSKWFELADARAKTILNCHYEGIQDPNTKDAPPSFFYWDSETNQACITKYWSEASTSAKITSLVSLIMMMNHSSPQTCSHVATDLRLEFYVN